MKWRISRTCSQVSGGVCYYCFRESYYLTYIKSNLNPQDCPSGLKEVEEVICQNCFNLIIQAIFNFCGVIWEDGTQKFLEKLGYKLIPEEKLNTLFDTETFKFDPQLSYNLFQFTPSLKKLK